MAGFIKGPLPDVPHVFGTAVYLTSEPSLVPSALFHNLKHYKVMHERTVFLHVVNEEVPRIDDQDRVTVTQPRASTTWMRASASARSPTCRRPWPWPARWASNWSR
jgi:K+ transporter